MKKYFMFADCHGDFSALMDAIERMGYDETNPDHQLVGLGDYFGRAAHSNSDCVAIWKYLAKGHHVNKPICLRGNHESILLDAIRRRQLTDVDIYNGEHNTFASFAGIYPSQMKYDCQRQFEAAKTMFDCGFVRWLENLPWYFEKKGFVCVHGFLPPNVYIEHIDCRSNILSPSVWSEASWAKTPMEISFFNRVNPEGIGKWVVLGHWRATELIWQYTGKDLDDGVSFCDSQHKLIGLDNTTVLSGIVGWAVLDEEGNLLRSNCVE